MGNADNALINNDITQQKIKDKVNSHNGILNDLTIEFNKLMSNLSSNEFLNEIFNEDFQFDRIDNIFKFKYSTNYNCVPVEPDSANLHFNNN